MKTRKEEPVNNHPGIYKLSSLDKRTGTWKFRGYRAVKRVSENGHSKKEQAVFMSLEEAKGFRNGTEPRQLQPCRSSEASIAPEKVRYTFGDLVEEFKRFHYLKLEVGTKQGYDRRLPHLDFLKSYDVEDIKISVVDELVRYWVMECPKSKRRENFENELDLLRTVLNFYRRRKNPAYIVPLYEDHWKAADIAKKVKKEVKSLSQEDLGRFLDALRDGRTPEYYALALCQFCFGLRIGEACGLRWEDLDLEHRIVRLVQTVIWDQWTWEPSIKGRPKNGRERVLVIPKILNEELKTLKKFRDPSVALVFHKKGRPLDRKSVATAYNRTLKRLEITHVSGTHMLRKTSATQANRVTGDFYAVSKLLDHSSPSITLKYVEEVSDQKRKVSDALNSVLEGIKNDSGFEHKEFEPSRAVPQKPTLWDGPKFTLIKSNG